MFTHRSTILRAAVGVTVLAAVMTGCSNGDSSGDSGSYPTKTIHFTVPAAAGGGWDTTARAMQSVLQDEKLVSRSIEVSNVEGGGGATGLAQLQKAKGDPQALMMTGLVMIGALQLADSQVSLSDTTPIATLTKETEAFVVPADSEYETIQDVVDDYLADPGSVIFGGGSAGGSDQLVAAQLVQEAGGDPAEMNYVGYSGGGEAIAGILSGDVAVGVSGLSEFTSQIESGDMRLLAVSTAEPVEVAGERTPTLQDAGFDIDFANWRAVVAAPGLSDEQRDEVIALVDKMHDSQAWTDALETNGWTDFYQTGDEAKAYIEAETERVADLYSQIGL